MFSTSYKIGMSANQKFGEITTRLELNVKTGCEIFIDSSTEFAKNYTQKSYSRDLFEEKFQKKTKKDSNPKFDQFEG